MMRNRADKTTTVRILATLISPTVGSAPVAGIPVGPEGAAEIRKRIAVTHGLIAGLGTAGSPSSSPPAGWRRPSGCATGWAIMSTSLWTIGRPEDLRAELFTRSLDVMV